MSLQLNKRSILRKTAQFGGLTFISRVLGMIRDLFLIKFLGVGAISDAFIIAFKIPNFLRRIFAEGALSAAFVPVFVRKVKKKELDNANGLMSASFLFFEGIVFLLCLVVFLYPQLILKIVATGFSEEQMSYAIPCLQILFPFIFFVSSSALLAGALNSVNHFFVPAFGPAILNLVFILTLLLCLQFNLSIYFLCAGILVGGFLQFLLHFIVYLKYNFKFGAIDKQSIEAFKEVLKKFLPTLVGVGIIEINLLVDINIASFLPEGSVSLLDYGSRFMRIPVGVFAVGFATVLLPHFSRYALYAPKRLNFYVLEVTKLVSWLIIPAMLFLMFISDGIFSIVMLNKKANLQDVWIAKWILIIYSAGLVFFCLNKILVNVFYSLHDTRTPTFALAISTVVNFIGNIIGMKLWGVFGIAGSTSFSALVLTYLLFIFLRKKHKFRFYSANYFNFLGRYVLQVLLVCTLFLILYLSFFKFLCCTDLYQFFYSGWGYWFLVFPLAALAGGLIFFGKKFFGIKLYFLSK